MTKNTIEISLLPLQLAIAACQHDVKWITPGYPGTGNFLVFNNKAPRAWPSATLRVEPGH